MAIQDLDLTLERDVIRKAIESIGAETKALEERLKRRQGREARARDEARRRAPGLSEQGDILQPVKAPNPRTDSNSALQVSDLRAQPPSPSPLKPVINIHEFENAILAPTDPWESQKEKGDKDYDLTMLREVMGGPSVASSSDTSPMKSVEQYGLIVLLCQDGSTSEIEQSHKCLARVAQFQHTYDRDPFRRLLLPLLLNLVSHIHLHNTARRSHNNNPGLHLHHHQFLNLRYRSNFLA